MKYLPTGKNKIQFEKWYVEDYKLARISDNTQKQIDYALNEFYKQDFREQIGVLLAYYDSIETNVDVFEVGGMMYSALVNNLMINQTEPNTWESRNEAYKEAFKKANEIENSK